MESSKRQILEKKKLVDDDDAEIAGSFEDSQAIDARARKLLVARLLLQAKDEYGSLNNDLCDVPLQTERNVDKLIHTLKQK